MAEMNTTADAEAALARSKFLATGLFVVMVGVYWVTRQLEGSAPWVYWVHVFAEAAMIGALADWFAVVALFRRPLGLPIPHTAIVPRNKARIGEMLGRFIQENFLAAEVVERSLAEVTFTERGLQWIGQDENLQRVLDRVVPMVPAALSVFRERDVQSFLHRNLGEYLRTANLAKGTGVLFEVLIAGGKHHEITNNLLKFGEHALNNHQQFLRDALRKNLPWYIPDFIHDSVYHSIVKRLRATLAEVNSDPMHKLRGQFLAMTEEFILRLKTSEEYREKGREWGASIVESSVVREYLNSLLSEIVDALTRDVQAEQSQVRIFIAQAIKGITGAVSADRDIQARIDRAIMQAIVATLRHHSGDIAGLVSGTVKSWDSATLIDKIELQVGRDLQFIRINGTLVGGLMGVLIHLLAS